MDKPIASFMINSIWGGEPALACENQEKEQLINPSRPILTLQKTCDEAVTTISAHIRQAGLQIMRTFDLRQARAGEWGCACPQHGTEQCDCQMIVLLVYGSGSQPATVVAHSHDGQTWVTLVERAEGTNMPFENFLRSVLLETPNEMQV